MFPYEYSVNKTVYKTRVDENTDGGILNIVYFGDQGEDEDQSK